MGNQGNPVIILVRLLVTVLQDLQGLRTLEDLGSKEIG
jgi:hypothetical protein